MRLINHKKCAPGILLTLTLLTIVRPALSQEVGANSELQQEVAALKWSVAQNQQALHHYTWTETRKTILNGKTESTRQSQCQYGADGKVQKTALGGDQPSPQRQRGTKSRDIEKKKDEMQAFAERVTSLIQRYVPPDASLMQGSYQSGRVTLQPSGDGFVKIVFRDYAKPEDTVTLTFDTAANKIQGYDVSTYLDTSEDVITLKVALESFPHGKSYIVRSVLDATAREIQIRTTNSGYIKL
jgi:hypothetical protein